MCVCVYQYLMFFLYKESERVRMYVKLWIRIRFMWTINHLRLPIASKLWWIHSILFIMPNTRIFTLNHNETFKFGGKMGTFFHSFDDSKPLSLFLQLDVGCTLYLKTGIFFVFTLSRMPNSFAILFHWMPVYGAIPISVYVLFIHSFEIIFISQTIW